MKLKRLHQRWRTAFESRLAVIDRLLHMPHSLDAAEVHDLRVALRRARLLASLGCHSLGKSEAKAFRDQAHTLLELLSPIRDCDVALEWFNETKASPKLVAKLQAHRERRWHAAQRRIRSSRNKLAVAFKARRHFPKLAFRLEKEMADAVQQCRVTSKEKELSTAQLHALRRVVRRWRYLRELRLKPSEQRRDRSLRLLVKVTDALGALQNIEAILSQLKFLGRMKELPQIRATLRKRFTQLRRDALLRIKALPVTV